MGCSSKNGFFRLILQFLSDMFLLAYTLRFKLKRDCGSFCIQNATFNNPVFWNFFMPGRRCDFFVYYRAGLQARLATLNFSIFSGNICIYSIS
jgi:hypothetical protein